MEGRNERKKASKERKNKEYSKGEGGITKARKWKKM